MVFETDVMGERQSEPLSLMDVMLNVPGSSAIRWNVVPDVAFRSLPCQV